jgi:error-prone DNA polymerase
VTRRDLLLHVAELDRWSRSTSAGAGKRVRTGTRAPVAAATPVPAGDPSARLGGGSVDVTGLTGIAGPAWESGVKAPNRPVTRGRPGARSPWTGQRLDESTTGPSAVDRAPSGGDDPPSSPTSAAANAASGATALATHAALTSSATLTSSAALTTYGGLDVAARAAAQSQAARPVVPAYAQPTQLTLDLGDTPRLEKGTGLPEMTGPERVRAELDILGLDASAHIVDFYGPMLDALGVTRSTEILQTRSRSEVLIAGVKVATQTPPIRSGRRVVFLTLDDATGPLDSTYPEDAQGPYATTVFHSWMLLVRGITRRTGPRGISVRATGAWELSGLWEAWTRGGLEAVVAALEAEDQAMVARNDAALAAATEADGRDRPVAARVSTSGGGRERGGDAADLDVYTGLPRGDRDDADYAARFERAAAVAAVAAGEEARHAARAGGMGGRGAVPPGRRVLVHASGFKQSPYADVKPAGEDSRGSRVLATSRTVPDAAGYRDAGGYPDATSARYPEGPGRDRDDDSDAIAADGVSGVGGMDTLGTPPRKLWHASPGSSGH